MAKLKVEEFYFRRNSIRLRGFDYAARRANFVTIVTHERTPFFNNAAIAISTIAALLSVREKFTFNLYSYCLMRNHFHALIGPGESGLSLGSICGYFKSLSTKNFWQFERGKLWQRQFFDHVIRNEQDFWETVDYIRMNPVKAGLVERREDWKHYGEPDLVE